MRIETLLSKFAIKGINYDPQSGGGKALLSAEEQLAVVGLCWHESPVGWLVLFVEGLRDVHALKQLQIATRGETLRLMEDWRGVYPEKALTALCATAIAEATQQNGQVCPECNGSALWWIRTVIVVNANAVKRVVLYGRKKRALLILLRFCL